VGKTAEAPVISHDAGSDLATSLTLLPMRTAARVLLVLAARLVAQAPDAPSARVVVRVMRGKDTPLTDAVVRSGRHGAKTDSGGRAMLTIPSGPTLIIAGPVEGRTLNAGVRMRL